MNIEKVKKQFKNQWILAKVLKEKPRTKEPLDIKVIARSRSRDKTQKAIRASADKHLIHFYAGPIPKKGYAVAF